MATYLQQDRKVGQEDIPQAVPEMNQDHNKIPDSLVKLRAELNIPYVN